MPDDLVRAFAALSTDSRRGLLLTGPELRHQAARRRARRAGVSTAAAVVLVAAAIGAGWTLTGAGGEGSTTPRAGSGAGAAPVLTVSALPSALPSTLPSSAPTSASPAATSPAPPSTSAATPSSRPPTSEPPVIPESIPDRALLSQADAHATVTVMNPPAGVPEFCAGATFPSRKRLGVSASMMSAYRKPDTPAGNIPDDSVYNTVGVYRGDGAQDYLAELRRGVETCATGVVRGLDTRFTELPSLGVGDESVLIQRSYEDVDAQGRRLDNGRYLDTYVAAVRVGDAVTVIDARGYENLSSDVASIRSLAVALAKRLEAWRG